MDILGLALWDVCRLITGVALFVIVSVALVLVEGAVFRLVRRVTLLFVSGVAVVVVHSVVESHVARGIVGAALLVSPAAPLAATAFAATFAEAEVKKVH